MHHPGRGALEQNSTADNDERVFESRGGSLAGGVAVPDVEVATTPCKNDRVVFELLRQGRVFPARRANRPSSETTQ